MSPSSRMPLFSLLPRISEDRPERHSGRTYAAGRPPTEILFSIAHAKVHAIGQRRCPKRMRAHSTAFMSNSVLGGTHAAAPNSDPQPRRANVSLLDIEGPLKALLAHSCAPGLIVYCACVRRCDSARRVAIKTFSLRVHCRPRESRPQNSADSLLGPRVR